jgi:phospholipid transport system substrate-binding protein
MPYRRILMVVGLLALVRALLLPPGAQAGEPTDQIRTEISLLYETLKPAAASSSREREAVNILDRMFDWQRMAEAALRGHWSQRTVEERGEFAQLFAEVFRRAYMSRIHVVDASKFEYLGDTIDRDRATVKTQVFTKRGSAIHVDYTAHRQEGRRWRVEDVRVEQVSLIDNYRTQFDSIIKRSSYAELVTMLRRGVAK